MTDERDINIADPDSRIDDSDGGAEGLVNLAENPRALVDDNYTEQVFDIKREDYSTHNDSEYSEADIQVLEGLEAVRKRPGMYIGDTTPRGLHHLVYEIVANSVDEALAGRCDRIDITLNADGSVTVQDDGSGIPVGIHPQTGIPTVQVVHTKLHAGGKFGGGAYSVSGGLHGVGASVVNALSEWMEVHVTRDEKIYRIAFSRGDTVEPLDVVGTAKPGVSGTRTVFRPDPEIFPDTRFDFDLMTTRYREMAFLNREVTINLTDARGEEPITRHLHYEGGIVSFIEYLNKNRTALHEPPIYIDGRIDDSYVEVAIQYNDSYNENVYTYANNIATIEGGTHLTGFRSALTKVINDYARQWNLLGKTDSNFSGDDVRENLRHRLGQDTDPQFEGQTKARLGNAEIRGLVETVMNGSCRTPSGTSCRRTHHRGQVHRSLPGPRGSAQGP